MHGMTRLPTAVVRLVAALRPAVACLAVAEAEPRRTFLLDPTQAGPEAIMAAVWEVKDLLSLTPAMVPRQV